jgi:hypothetical protein
MTIAACALCVGVSPGFAQTWQTTTAPNQSWRSLACSGDGTKLAAVVTRYPWIYASTNSGITWFISGAPSNDWTWVALSADGQKVAASAAVIYSPTGGGVRGGPIFQSTDSGATWSLTGAPTNQWSCVASSADGSTLVACATYTNASTAPGFIFVSKDSGTNWAVTSAPAKRWDTVACSADGTRIVAAGNGAFTSSAAGGGIFMSLDSGATWISNNISLNASWESVGVSADGSTVVGVRSYTAPNPPAVFVSTDWGSTWTSNSLPNVGRGYVAASADGSTVMASKGHLYISTNFGVTWVRNFIPGQTYGWGSACVASSADGQKLFLALGADDFGQPRTIYTRYVAAQPRLEFAPLGASLKLSWVLPSTNFVIQEASTLGANNWSPRTNIPTLNLTTLRNEVMVTPADVGGFYRLATP